MHSCWSKHDLWEIFTSLGIITKYIVHFCSDTFETDFIQISGKRKNLESETYSQAFRVKFYKLSVYIQIKTNFLKQSHNIGIR